jgi:hypothetical protein
MGVITWRSLLIAVLAVSAFFLWDAMYRTRLSHMVLTNHFEDTSLLAHYKPGLAVLVQLTQGQPLRRNAITYQHGVLFSFRNSLLAPHYAKQCSEGSMVWRIVSFYLLLVSYRFLVCYVRFFILISGATSATCSIFVRDGR